MICPMVLSVVRVSCQVHTDRHLHSFANVDVGIDCDTCGRMSVFAHDRLPDGGYHTRTRTDTPTRIPGKELQV